jgi:hypothetical protein
MSAVFFQDAVGLITFDDGFTNIAGLRPRIGKNQVINCLDVYQRRSAVNGRAAKSLAGSIAGFMRKISLVPVVSDFLFEGADEIIRELATLNTLHDVFLTVVDASFAFDVPRVSAGWMKVHDVETGRSRVISRGDARRLATRVREWQDGVVRQARSSGLDVLRLGLDQRQFDIALVEFVIERRLRRKTA